MKTISNLLYKVANRIIRQMKWYNNYWQGAQKFWNINTFELDVVNLGSGAALHAFDYSQCDIKGMNWALSPQSLVHDYNILRNYFSYLKNGATVIITICPFSCLFSQYNKEAKFKYYTFLHPATIIDFDDNERTRALSIKQNPFKYMPSKSIILSIKEYLGYIKHYILLKKNAPDLQRSADIMLDGWKKQFGITDLKSPLSQKHLKEKKARHETLIEIVDFCKERDLKPVIVIPPMHVTLTKQFPKEMIVNYIDSFLEGVNVPIFNYMSNELFLEEKYYKEALFLNSEGAKVFTEQIINDINI